MNTCALPECGKLFVPKRKARCCTRKHGKLLSERKRQGLITIHIVCALPECSNTFWTSHHSGQKPGMKINKKGRHYKIFCCAYHGDLHTRRRHNGVYLRVRGEGPVCCAPNCNERIALDEHHIEFGSKGSNKKSKVVWLCPTHHMYIHRRYAEFRNGEFVDLVSKIRYGLRWKRRIFHGYTWTEAK